MFATAIGVARKAFSEPRIASRKRTTRAWARALATSTAMAAAFLAAPLPETANVRPAGAEAPALEPGAAFATSFSGILEVETEDGEIDVVIDPEGIVGVIVDIRNPGREPQGRHWADEPQSAQITAEEAGQVFGIAIDDADPASIFVTATSAFGLHRSDDNERWMDGMWGPGGGPGTIYRLGPDTGYRPEVFAQVTLDGRENTGAALGNIAYDRWHKQLFVSDLETGMIFRLDVGSGDILDYYDHGVDGRARFYDAEGGTTRELDIVPFAPGTAAEIEDCDTDFAGTPECWNVADFRRRVWGLGLFPEPDGDTVRLYYAIWGSDPLGSSDWARAGVDRRNSLWSVAIGADGRFDIDDVRREFIVPDFDEDGLQNAAAVTDLAFSRDGTVILAERGGLRNLGLDGDHPFATPHISRVLQYKRRASDGDWKFLARFDIGFYDRVNDGAPYIRANAAGGVDFGFGYTEDGSLDAMRPDAIMWASGDALCSPDGPCRADGDLMRSDEDQVHGLQGTPRRYDAELVPAAALADYPDAGDPYAPDGPANSYLIDLDLNIDAFGRVNPYEAERDDTSWVGDVEVFRSLDFIIAAPEPEAPVALLDPLPEIEVPEPPGGAQGQNPDGGAPQNIAPEQDFAPGDASGLAVFHQRYQSDWHDRSISAPVHDGNISHNRAGSQLHSQQQQSAGGFAGGDSALAGHVQPWSHYRPGSHARRASWQHFRNSSYIDHHRRIESTLD